MNKETPNPSKDLQEKIKKIFFGDAPEMYDLLTEDRLDKIRELMQQSNYEVNFVNFIQLMGGDIAKEVRGNEKYQNLTKSQVKQIRQDHHTAVTSMLLEAKQDASLPRKSVLLLLTQLRTMIKTIYEVYNIKLVPNYKAYMKFLDETEIELLEHILRNAEVKEERIAISDSNDVDLESYDLHYWPYKDKKKILRLEKLLISGGLMVNVPTFYSLFSLVNSERIIWLGKQAALLYLLYRLTDRTMVFKDLRMYKFAERFSINGKPLSAKAAASTFYNFSHQHLNISPSQRQYNKPDYVTAIDAIMDAVMQP